MQRNLLLVFICSFLTMPLFSQSNINPEDLHGTYKIKDPQKDDYFVTLEKNNMTLHEEEDADEDQRIQGTWSMEGSKLTVGYEMDSEPVELEIDFANINLDQLKRGTFVKSIKRTFDREESFKLWIKKTT